MSPVVVRPRTATAAELQRRLQLGLGAVRAVTLAWAGVVALVDASSGVLARPGWALAGLALLGAWSALWTWWVARRDRRASGPVPVVVDLALAAATVVADELVYRGDRSQSLGSAWPLAAVMAAGVAAGPRWGLAGGVAVGLANVGAAVGTGAVSGRVLALTGATVLYGAAGWVAGWVASQLRRTAEVAAAAEARAEVARTLHDGVLQTLAVVQRRSDDPELVELARTQDAELRSFLRGDPADAPTGAGGVAALLGPALARVEGRHGITTHLVVIDAGTAGGVAAEALVAAAAEAATNAAKHGGVRDVWVSVDARLPVGTAVVVHDEGAGFDPASTPEGDGLTRSVRERLAAVGGAADVRAAPGAGCEVTLWAP